MKKRKIVLYFPAGKRLERLERVHGEIGRQIGGHKARFISL